MTETRDAASAPTGAGFKLLCRVSPVLALHVREYVIRALKPGLRAKHPGWRWGGASSEARS